jgi:hypothetical protein
MTDAPSRQLLRDLGEDLALGSAWGALAVRATTAVERRWLLGQLRRRLLVCTPAARARLRSWLDLQRMAPSPPPPPAQLPRWIRERVLYYGDRVVLEAVVEALVRVPDPVRAAALDEIAFLGVGAEARGWTGSSNLVDRHGESRPRLVNLSGADCHVPDLIEVAIHEVAHGWLMPRPIALVTTQGEANLRAVAAEDGWLERADVQVARDERLAWACTWAWLTAAGAR